MDTRNLQRLIDKLLIIGIAMGGAIDNVVKELTENGKFTIMFYDTIDCASCDPLVLLEYNAKEKCSYAISRHNDYVCMTNLSTNELYDICWKLIHKDYQLC